MVPQPNRIAAPKLPHDDGEAVTAAKRPWDPLTDGLVPLAEGLWKVASRWYVVGPNNHANGPRPVEVEWLYKDCKLDLILDWIEVRRSPATAQSLRRSLYRPLKRFQSLNFRACKAITGAAAGAKSVTVVQNAIRIMRDRESSAAARGRRGRS